MGSQIAYSLMQDAIVAFTREGHTPMIRESKQQINVHLKSAYTHSFDFLEGEQKRRKKVIECFFFGKL